MARRRKSKLDKWDAIVIALIIVSLVLMVWTYAIRTQEGVETYYSDYWIIFLNDVSRTVFFALLTGYVVAKLVEKARR